MGAVPGVNHQFLWQESVSYASSHLATLRLAAALKNVEALDCWCCRGEQAEEEIRILQASGKQIHYNIGDRFGEKVSFPVSASAEEREYAYDVIMREIGYALRAGAQKIVFASGPDVPDGRESALERYYAFVCKIASQVTIRPWPPI